MRARTKARIVGLILALFLTAPVLFPVGDLRAHAAGSSPPAPGSGPAPAESIPMRQYTDPGHRFTVAFPAAWKVSWVAKTSSIEGVAPDGPALLHVLIGRVDSPSSRDFAKFGVEYGQKHLAGFAVLQEGPTQLAGLPAYFVYQTFSHQDGGTLYALNVYLVTSRWEYVIGGITRNEPALIQKAFPVFFRIIGTFRPE